MFTGIVEAVGKVVGVAGAPRLDPSGTQAHHLGVQLEGLLSDLQPGASVAVNGACLTLTEPRGAVGSFDVVPETWRNTSLRTLRVGDPVNLERALRVGDRIDGHFVQGHVDAVGTVDRIEAGAGERKLWVTADDQLMPYIVRKGSIALDGTSLTVVEVVERRFSVALIPTTLERTVLGRHRPGDLINIETDILARLVMSRLTAAGLLDQRSGSPGSGITFEGLREGGYL